MLGYHVSPPTGNMVHQVHNLESCYVAWVVWVSLSCVIYRSCVRCFHFVLWSLEALHGYLKGWVEIQKVGWWGGYCIWNAPLLWHQKLLPELKKCKKNAIKIISHLSLITYQLMGIKWLENPTAIWEPLIGSFLNTRRGPSKKMWAA